MVGSNYKATQFAFYNAEAGVQYTLAHVSTTLASGGALSLNGEKASEAYTIEPPSGFLFEISSKDTFTRVANTRKYFFRVTGRSQPNSAIRSTIEAVLQRASLLPYGMFGDERIDLPTSGAVYSYDSRITANPTPAGSTGEANVGSNGVISAYTGKLLADIDGSISLGDNGAGTEGVFEFKSPKLTYLPPEAIEVGPVGNQQKIGLTDVERVAPDPLNAAARVDTRSSNNDNAAVGIINDQLTLSGGMTLGPGNYYLTAMTLNSGAELTVDPSGGVVNIYLDGKLEAKFGSRLTILGPPTRFRIYSKAKESLIFLNHGDFRGLVYAPFASIAMKNTSMKSYGLLWGKRIDMIVDWGPVHFYVDTALYDLFLATDVTLMSWKDLRN
jgi:hypothetical protein